MNTWAVVSKGTMTKPVKVRRFEDQYPQDMVKGTPRTPAEGEAILKKEGEGPHDTVLASEEQRKYRSATAVLLHMMRWSRVETMNAIQGCSRYMTEARK